MKRQQSFQDDPSKRRCLQQQFGMNIQENQPPVSQWPSNSRQFWDRFPQQPVQQHVQQHYYYNNGSNSNTTAFPLDNRGYNGSVNYVPLPHSPLQYTPMQYTPMQYAPIQYTPMQFTQTQIALEQLLPTQFTGLSTNFDMTFGGGCINNNILLQHDTHMPNYKFDFNVTTQNQPNTETIHPNLLEKAGTSQPPSEPRRPFRCVVDMPGMPTGINANYSPPIGSNIPDKVPMNVPEHYELGLCVPAVRRELSKSKDVNGVDLAAIGRSKPTPQKEKQRENDLEGKTNQSQIQKPDPYGGLGPIMDWLDLEKQHEIALEEEKKKKKKKENQEKAKDHAQVLDSYNRLSEYPAECYEHLRLPGCKFRAQAIRVGWPRPEWLRSQGEARMKRKFSVCAVRRAGGDGIKFKLVESGSTVQEVMKSQDIQFNDIQMNQTFSDMNELKVTQLSQYLLDAVPGTTDSVTMWG
ncbi:hypothetical protein GGR58DRAFT_527355 [Xylaria digitata]|nr:hypothetical protein GGR58DRAFT_527355 [Xylaria digitata]